MRPQQGIKRGALESADARVTKRTKYSEKDNVVPGTYFPFLDLPAELRNSIYGKVFDESPRAYLTIRTRSNLASRSALPRVRRPIRNEFRPVLYLSAHEIVARVIDFDFGHIVTFLNRLSKVEMKGLEGIETQSSRKLIVELNFAKTTLQNACRYSWLPSLMRWLNRLEHPRKKGTKIDISYIQPHQDVGPPFRNIRRALRRRFSLDEEGRRKTEIGKIVNAVAPAQNDD